MPQFKVAKTDDITKLNNNEVIEDKLYIYKETNKLGRLFYDYADGTRIEIGALDNIYNCIDKLTEDVEIIDLNKLRKYSSNNELLMVSTHEVQLNSLVTSDKAIYNIRHIDRQMVGATLTTTLTLRRIYIQHDLKWKDYYE